MININEIIAEFAIVTEEEINADDILVEIGIDSLRIVELIVTLEEKLNIRFDDSKLNPSELKAIKDIFELIEEHGIEIWKNN